MIDVLPSPDVVDEAFNNSPNGIACTFIKLNDDWGLKLWRWPDDRDRAFAAQEALAKVDLAPQVGEKFEIHLPRMGMRYGFVTQVAEPILANVPGRNSCEDLGNFEKSLSPEALRDLCNERDSLCRAVCSKTDYGFSDSHWFNVGRINGNMVAIDTGPESMYLRR